MSARDSPKPESTDTGETTSSHRTDILLVSDLLDRNDIEVIDAEPETRPYVEVATTKDKIESIQAVLKDAETDQQYRIITPTDTNSLREWPISNREPDQPRTVFVIPRRGISFTPEQKNILRAAHI